MRHWNFGKGFEAFDILAAATLLTRIPVPLDHARAGERASAAAWAFPLVGAFIGAFAGVILAVLVGIGVERGIAAALALGFLAFATGAMHEDGLADCADGIGGGRDRDHALKIMKDSRVGAYGAVAIGVVLLARWSGIADFSGWRAVFVLMAVGATSRAIMVVPMSLMPNARASGLSASAGIASRDAMLLALGIAALIGLVFTGFSGIAALAVAAVASLPLLALAHFKLGGQTGDVLGGTQQCAEVGALLAFTALL